MRTYDIKGATENWDKIHLSKKGYCSLNREKPGNIRYMSKLDLMSLSFSKCAYMILSTVENFRKRTLCRDDNNVTIVSNYIVTLEVNSKDWLSKEQGTELWNKKPSRITDTKTGHREPVEKALSTEL